MSEQVNTMWGQGAHFPFSSPKEESSLSPFSQSQTDLRTANVTDKRQRENNREKASKNKNSALQLNTKQRCNRSGATWRERERLKLEEWERKRVNWESVAFFCLAVHWGEGREPPGTGRDWAAELCLLLLSFVRKKNRREVWSVLEHLHAGLQLGGYVFEKTVPKYRLFFFVMLISK